MKGKPVDQEAEQKSACRAIVGCSDSEANLSNVTETKGFEEVEIISIRLG